MAVLSLFVQGYGWENIQTVTQPADTDGKISKLNIIRNSCLYYPPGGETHTQTTIIWFSFKFNWIWSFSFRLWTKRISNWFINQKVNCHCDQIPFSTLKKEQV